MIHASTTPALADDVASFTAVVPMAAPAAIRAACDDIARPRSTLAISVGMALGNPMSW